MFINPVGNFPKLEQMEMAAALACDDYDNDKKLTAFIALDGEPIYEIEPEEQVTI